MSFFLKIFLLGSSFLYRHYISVRFEKYPEDNASDLYGRPAPDPYGKDFPDFDYTSI